MAVTYITRIYATIDKSIDYIVRDKAVLSDIKDINEEDYKVQGDKVVLRNNAMQEQLGREALSTADKYLENAIDYIERDKELLGADGKVEIRKTLTSALNCCYDSAKDEFMILKDQHNNESNKNGIGKNKREILGYHVWQSFEEMIDGELANKIGVELASELYGKHQCVISTHTNTDHTHNHIVFNSTSLMGGKYHLNTENTRKLREVSDKLCEKYGLKVLQNTKDMNLKWYKDEAGNWKCFEPTERKSKVEKGQYSKKNDYRNYEAYLKSEQFKKNEHDIIRKDIDRFIPYSKDLDDLLSKLKDIGYEVKNLNSKGGELKYISFKSPTGDKFLRGNANSLGEDYTRENIIKRIEEANKTNDKEQGYSSESKDEKQEGKSRNSEAYNFHTVNIEDIDEEKRKRYNKENNTWGWIKRSDIEKYVIADIKILNNQLDSIYKSAEYKREQAKRYYGKNAEHYKTIDNINDNLKALQFLENKNIQSFQQINDTVASLYNKSEQIDEELVKIRNYLKQMNMDIVLIKQYNDLKHNIEVNKSNADYVAYEMQGEKALLDKYDEILKAKKLVTPEQQNDYVTKFNNFNARYVELAKAKEQMNNIVKQYNSTVKTIDRIDRIYDRKYRNDIMEYYNIGKDYNKEKDNEASNKNKKRNYQR